MVVQQLLEEIYIILYYFYNLRTVERLLDGGQTKNNNQG